MTMNKTKRGAGQKRAGCRELSSEFSFLCVLYGSALMGSTQASKTSEKRRAQ